MVKKALSKSDKKPTLISWLRIAAIICAVLVVITAIFMLRHDFNAEGIQKIRYYLSDLAAGGLSFSGYDYDPDLTAYFSPLGNGLGVYNGDIYSFVSDLGSRDRTQLGYRSPVTVSSGPYLLIYDCDGTGLFLTTSYGTLLNAHLMSRMISASVNQKGYITAVTKESGYRSGLTVYSKSMKKLFSWQTPDYYILSAELSPDCKTAAALCLSASDGEMKVLLRLFDITGSRDTADIPIEEEAVSLCYGGKGELYIICCQSLLRYNGSLSEVSAFDSLRYISQRPCDGLALCVESDGIYRLVVTGKKDTVLDFCPSSLSYLDGSAAVLYDEEISVFNGNRCAKYDATGSMAVLLSKNGPLSVRSDRVSIAPKEANNEH